MNEQEKNIYTDEDVAMSDVLHHHMKEYSEFTIDDLFGHVIDGLNKVYRRILLVFSKDNEFHKVALWGGLCQAWHPHSDTSIHASIAKLMQNFRYQIPLLQHQGNSGSYLSTKSAAPRYLQAMATEFMKDVYFDTIKEALVYEFSDVANAPEPQYLVPKIPMTIYISNQGIASGFSTFTIPKDLSGVCDFTIWYIDQLLEDKHEFLISNKFPREVCSYLLPMFPISCNVLNREELLNKYEQGNYDAQIIFEGNTYITKNSIVIKTIKFGTKFKTKFKPFLKALKEKQKSIADLSEALDEFFDHVADVKSIDFKLIFKKKYSSWAFLSRIEKLFDVHGKITGNSRFVTKNKDNQKLGPGQLVEIWFRERERVLQLKYSKYQETTFKELHILEGLLIIKDHVDEVIEIIKRAESSEAYIQELSDRFGLSLFQASQIGQMKVDELKKSNRENLPILIQKQKDYLDELKYSMTHIPEIIKKEVLTIKEKYGNKATKPTNYPTYHGFIKTEDDGHIQIENIKEVIKYKGFDEFEVSIFPSSCYKFRYRSKNDTGRYEVDHPVLFKKHFQTKDPLMFSPTLADTTVVLNKTAEGATIFRINSLCNDPTVDKVCTFCNDKVLTINSMGDVGTTNVKLLPLRKSFQSLGNKTDVIFISNIIFSTIVVFYTNPHEPNSVRVSVINKNNQRLNLLAGYEHQTKFHIFPFVNETIVFKPQSEIFNRIKEGHLEFESIVSFMGGSKFSILNLNAGSCSHSKTKFKLKHFAT